ncbi:MAG: hypothetical protein RL681_136 [Candidatus Parcubacteria bacterium]|jgi:hypothetical protein
MDDFRKQALLNAGLIMLGFAACVGVGVWLASGVREQASEIITKRALIRRQAQTIQLLADFKQISADVDFYMAKLKTFVPAEDEILDFRRWVRSLGEQHGVAVNEVVFRSGGAKPSPEGLGYSEFGLSVQGTEQQLGSFLDSLEIRTPKYLAQLTGFELVENGATYRMQSRGNVYFR